MTRFGVIGGMGAKNTTARILAKLLTDRLAAQFSWLGRREKRNFSKLKLVHVLLGTYATVNCDFLPAVSSVTIFDTQTILSRLTKNNFA